MKPSPWVLAAIAAIAIIVIGCGGSSSAEGTELSLRQAARDLHVAFLEGADDEAYGYYSKRCKDRIGLQEYRSLARATRSLMELIGGDLDSFFVRDVHVRNVDGRTGETRTIVVIAGNPEVTLDDLDWQRWSFDSGRWLVTSCDAPGG